MLQHLLPATQSEIDRVDAPSSQKLLQYIENNTPVIITNGISNWKALKSWDIRYLKSKSSSDKLFSVYNQPVRGNTSKNMRNHIRLLIRGSGEFPDPPYEMKFHDYLDYWQQPADESIPDIFLGNLEVNSLAQDLVEDISPLPPLADEKCKSRSDSFDLATLQHINQTSIIS